jgi:putative serine protease PepD
MTSPKHLWSGDWRSESDKARDAAAQAAPPPPPPAEPSGPEAPTERPPRPPRPQRTRAPRRPATRALVIGALVLALAVAAFFAGLANSGDDSPKPLTSSTSTPIKPHKGQTQAGAIYAKASPAVVSVRTGSGSGTGFLIDRSGTIVTNAHVVGQDKRVTVRFGQDSPALAARVLGSDPSSDLAALKIDNSGIPKGVTPLAFADSDSVQVGDVAIAIGNPFDLDRTATEGIVSGIGREIRAPNGFQIDKVIQTDAPINPGNSGGPLLDDGGRVIGVNSQIATAGSQGNVGIGFAVPSNSVRQVIPRLTHGEAIQRPYLGVSTGPTSLANSAGAKVATVVSGGPADKAGIQEGDVIVEVAGKPVKEPADVASAIADKKPGDHVDVKVQRDGFTQGLDATLGKRPANTTP